MWKSEGKTRLFKQTRRVTPDFAASNGRPNLLWVDFWGLIFWSNDSESSLWFLNTLCWSANANLLQLEVKSGPLSLLITSQPGDKIKHYSYQKGTTICWNFKDYRSLEKGLEGHFQCIQRIQRRFLWRQENSWFSNPQNRSFSFQRSAISCKNETC